MSKDQRKNHKLHVWPKGKDASELRLFNFTCFANIYLNLRMLFNYLELHNILIFLLLYLKTDISIKKVIKFDSGSCLFSCMKKELF